MVAHAFDPRTPEAEAHRSLWASLVYIPGQPGQHRVTLSSNTKMKNQKIRRRKTRRRKKKKKNPKGP